MMNKVFSYIIGLGLLTIAIDIATPPDVAMGVPYAAFVILGGFLLLGKNLIKLGVGASILLAIGFYLSLPNEDFVVQTINRLYALIAIWVAVSVLYYFNKKTNSLDENNSLLLRNSPLGVIQWDKNFNCTLWNQAAENIFGYTEKEALGKNIEDLIKPGGSQDPARVFFQNILSEKNDGHAIFNNKSKDGSTIICECFNTPIKDIKGKTIGLATFVQDITQRKMMENSLQESEERFRLAFKYFPTGYIEIDEYGTVETFNPAAEIIFDYKSKEVIGKNVKIIMPKKTAEVHDKYIENHLTTGKKNIIGIGREVVGRRKSGEEFPLHLGIGKMTIEGKTKFIGSITDLTQVKNLELLLRRSQKMEAIGELTGGIAHDFNNLLGIIIGNIDLLKYKIKDEDKLGIHADKVLTAAMRGSELTKRLLNFSHQSTEASSPINLNNVISNMKSFIGKSLTANIRFEFELDENLWQAEINPGDLEDALLNLSLNARDAMPDGGQIIVETKNITLDPSFTNPVEGLEAGDFVEVSISDTGEGMPQELTDLIFDPFFTTKEKEKGTGLGLAMVYSFVKRSNGHIKVFSKENIGATFKMYFPRSLGDILLGKSHPNEIAKLPQGTETILIVDDDEELAEVANMTLKNLGYKTIVAYDGDEALLALENFPSIKLMFSDVVMAGSLNGFLLAEAANHKYPDLKILLTSGFTGKMALSKKSEEWKDKLLPKPYRDVELAIAIRNTLDKEN